MGNMMGGTNCVSAGVKFSSFIYWMMRGGVKYMDIYLASDINNSIIESLTDGTGIRLVIFTCGCIHHCPECQNPKSWDIKNGVRIPVVKVANYIIKKLYEGDFDGITLSGGDPLYQSDAILELLVILKNKIKSLNIWCYTGYLYEEVKNLKAIKYIDTLVDGPFEKDKKFPKKKFRGSWNQRILHLSNGSVVMEE